MKVSITNAYTWNNKGDAGILVGTLEQLSRMFDDLEVNILSFTPDLDRPHYKQFSFVNNVYSNILNPYPFKKTKIGKLTAVTKLALKALGIFVMFFCFKSIYAKRNKQLNVLSDSDLIVVCGGGFLGGKKFSSLIHLFQIYIISYLKSKIVIWGTSVEPPANAVLQFVTERVLQRMDVVFPRETITSEYLATFLPDTKLHMTPDLAFLVKPQPSLRVQEIVGKFDSEHTYIGITVRKWHFPKSPNPVEAMVNYKRAVTSCIEYLVKESNVIFVFVPQVIFDGDDDRKVAREITDSLPSEVNNFIILEDNFSPGEIKYLISHFDLFIGTRMHSNIFAASSTVPTIGVAYEAKTNGIMQMLGLGNYVIPIEDVTAYSLVNLVRLASVDSSRIKSDLTVKQKQLVNEIERQATVLKELVI